jgi:hypothetical protein
MDIIQPESTNDVTLLSTNIAESDFPEFQIDVEYSINDTVIYIGNNIHWVVRSKTNENIGNFPTGIETDLNWVKVSETNRWKMFDLQTTSQTVNLDSIDVTIASVSQTDSLALLNISGAWLDVLIKDQFDNEIYSVSQSLVSTNGIYDPYTYFFSPIVFIQDIIFTDIPPYALSTVQVVISNEDNLVKCGSMLIGKLISAGLTEYGMGIGIVDYSVKTTNEFGDFVITERAYSKTLELTSYVDNTEVDRIANFLNTFRATPVVWIGSSQYGSSFIYGFYKDYAVIVQYPTLSLLNIEIEGLS